MLTRSQIAKASADAQVDFCLDKQPTYEVALARRIESAACAERDARIAELEAAAFRDSTALNYWKDKCALLEQQLAEARKDAMNAAALICDALPSPPSCNALERNLWDVATVAAADAIRAAIKEQT